jgi:hypothetical protein
MQMKKGILSGVVSFVALASGFWFGGDSEAIISVTGVGVLIFLCIAALVSSSARLLSRVTLVVVTFFLFGFGWYLGRAEMSSAFNQCVEDGESVRQALSSFSKVNGHFPESLRELQLSKVPGKRILHSGLLSYARRDTGYLLTFSDWLVTHSANESEGFVARK